MPRKFDVGDTFILHSMPERLDFPKNIRVWSVYRDVDTIPIEIIKVAKTKEEYQREYGKYLYQCKPTHDDPSTYDLFYLTEAELFHHSC